MYNHVIYNIIIILIFVCFCTVKASHPNPFKPELLHLSGTYLDVSFLLVLIASLIFLGFKNSIYREAIGILFLLTV